MFHIRIVDVVKSKAKLSRYVMQAPRGEEVQLLLMLDLGTRG
jgi:hypothetical protein